MVLLVTLGHALVRPTALLSGVLLNFKLSRAAPIHELAALHLAELEKRSYTKGLVCVYQKMASVSVSARVGVTTSGAPPHPRSRGFLL